MASSSESKNDGSEAKRCQKPKKDPLRSQEERHSWAGASAQAGIGGLDVQSSARAALCLANFQLADPLVAVSTVWLFYQIISFID